MVIDFRHVFTALLAFDTLRIFFSFRTTIYVFQDCLAEIKPSPQNDPGDELLRELEGKLATATHPQRIAFYQEGKQILGSIPAQDRSSRISPYRYVALTLMLISIGIQAIIVIGFVWMVAQLAGVIPDNFHNLYAIVIPPALLSWMLPPVVERINRGIVDDEDKPSDAEDSYEIVRLILAGYAPEEAKGKIAKH